MRLFYSQRCVAKMVWTNDIHSGFLSSPSVSLLTDSCRANEVASR